MVNGEGEHYALAAVLDKVTWFGKLIKKIELAKMYQLELVY